MIPSVQTLVQGASAPREARMLLIHQNAPLWDAITGLPFAPSSKPCYRTTRQETQSLEGPMQSS